MSSPAPVLAAGAVCWREAADGRVEIVLVHRPRHRDVSLPKGKVDPGETLPQTAVREIAEETGLSIALGVPLGDVRYRLPGGRRKVVHYWAAEVEPMAIANSTFAANDEIEELRWVTLDVARAELSYPHDVEIVDRFAALHAAGDARSFALIALRHGKALPPGDWDGPDSTRPLMQRGLTQAAGIAAGIAAFRPARLVSSPAERCLRTIAPTARLTGLDVVEEPRISQDDWRPEGRRVAKVVRTRLARGVTAVLCSHGPVLPQIVQAVAAATDPIPGGSRRRALERAASLSVGEYAVLHVSAAHPDAGILAIEVHSPSE
ncbi:MAG: NUDIX hydrolase [Actinomycetales bacterium]|nr:NUDIX hydrolase [Actinomycetales bacterium]